MDQRSVFSLAASGGERIIARGAATPRDAFPPVAIASAHTDISARFNRQPSAPLFQALEQQLGVKLDATRGTVSILVIDRVMRPTLD